MLHYRCPAAGRLPLGERTSSEQVVVRSSLYLGLLFTRTGSHWRRIQLCSHSFFQKPLKLGCSLWSKEGAVLTIQWPVPPGESIPINPSAGTLVRRWWTAPGRWELVPDEWQ